MNKTMYFIGLVTAMLLSACGGGGGGVDIATPPSPTPSASKTIDGITAASSLTAVGAN